MSPPDGAAAARRIIEEASEVTDRDMWPEPDLRLIDDDRMPPPVFEDDGLPAGLAEWIRARGDGAGMSAGLCSGRPHRRRLRFNWKCPTHWGDGNVDRAADLWLALIGSPSTGKTPALRPIVDACLAIEREAEPAWQAAMAEYSELAEGARAIEQQWREAVRAATRDGEPLPERPPGADSPPEPPRPRVLVNDATTEELQRLLTGQPRGLFYTRDELAGWLGNFDRYGGNGGSADRRWQGVDRRRALAKQPAARRTVRAAPLCWRGDRYVASAIASTL